MFSAALTYVVPWEDSTLRATFEVLGLTATFEVLGLTDALAQDDYGAQLPCLRAARGRACVNGPGAVTTGVAAPGAQRSASTPSSASQGSFRSVRPKCPYTARRG